jgi:hypothetical protein
VRGATRLRNSTYLRQHTQRIVAGPGFLYLASGYADNGDPPHLHPVATRGDAHKFALMGAVPGPAGHHLVPFNYLVLDSDVGVGKSAAVEAYNVFLALRAGQYVGKGRIMSNMVGGNDLVSHVQVSLVKKVLEPTTDEGLVLFS